MVKIFANIRRDGTREFLGKQDFGFIYGNEEHWVVQFHHRLSEFEKKNNGLKPTHSMIIEEIKAKRVLEALPFMLTKNSMSEVFKLAEDM